MRANIWICFVYFIFSSCFYLRILHTFRNLLSSFMLLLHFKMTYSSIFGTSETFENVMNKTKNEHQIEVVFFWLFEEQQIRKGNKFIMNRKKNA